ncbi:MAG: DegT/DnrJ/EryC1/StrS family aminotransferase, partial [Nanoarchaeota archaeon]
MEKVIPYGKQSISEEDFSAVSTTLQSDYLTCGPKVKEFEDKFAAYVGARYAVAVANGTAALHLACLAAGLKVGEELITSPMTFAASANCALYCQAKPVFVD